MGAAVRIAANEAKAVPLSQIEMTQEQRVSTGMKELDRVLGGGIVQGSLVLVGGDPGIGKSTLLLLVCRNLAEHKVKVLYISGEESLAADQNPGRTHRNLWGQQLKSAL